MHCVKREIQDGVAIGSLRGRPSVLRGGCPLQIRPPLKLRACHAGYVDADLKWDSTVCTLVPTPLHFLSHPN
jgi:hypothetical protein